MQILKYATMIFLLLQIGIQLLANTAPLRLQPLTRTRWWSGADQSSRAGLFLGLLMTAIGQHAV